MEAGFLEGTAGPVFYVLHLPDKTPCRGCILFVPPFAEELNKSRRMVNLQARRMAQAGFAVAIPDLWGCGDSGGDFADADWDIWLDDLTRCADLMAARCDGPLLAWGLRAGCLLAGDWQAARPEPLAGALYWQPVTNGEQHLIQFLRLRMAAGLIGGERESTAQLRARLEQEEPLEVAGYTLPPRLAASLARSRLRAPQARAVAWLEVVAGEGAALSPASERIVERWRTEAVSVEAAVVNGNAFWSTHDIIEVPGLMDATMQQLEKIACANGP